MELSSDWGTVRLGAWYYANNVWGGGDSINGIDYYQRLLLTGRDDPLRIEWDWPASGDVRAYPEVVLGQKPWDLVPSTTPNLPIKLSDMGDIDISFDIDWGGAPGADYNIAFSVWVNDDPNAWSAGIRDEIMIWVRTGDFAPAGSVIGSYADSLGSALVYHREDHGDAAGNAGISWSYTALDYTVDARSGVIDLDGFLDHLVTLGILDADHYLMNVELGAEVAEGAGWFEINDLAVSFDGQADSVTPAALYHRHEGLTAHDVVTFDWDRTDYRIERGADGVILVTDTRELTSWNHFGQTELVGIERLDFYDRSYDLTIAEKAASISPQQLDSLIDLYVGYFNRIPEASGLGFWIDELRAGETLDQIAVRFYEAGVVFSEVTGYSADMSLEDFILMAYANVLSRGPDDAGIAPTAGEVGWWVAEISEGRATREGMIQRFLEDSRLFADDPKWGFMADLLDNKVELGRLHAVTYGLDYLDQYTATTTTREITALVTANGIDAAVAMIGLGPETYLA